MNGFTYITALVFVAVMGIALSAASGVWSTVMKREREQELLFRGDQIRRAIESYSKKTPGGRKPEFPRSLENLVNDSRFPAVTRHLRVVYRNPLSPDGKWEFILDARGGIKGVYAKSQDMPLKKANFPAGYESFEKAGSYSDWKFTPAPEKKAQPVTAPAKGAAKKP
ncbi:MAG: type II secretion system protein [Deltaproteobacteria bacterium]|nr:type II secretion system protein [Deltaproteobacteria bacterium]